MVGDVLAALHEVLERHQVTEQEWMAALAFLTEVGRADEFVLLSDVTRTSVLIDALSHAGDEDGATASDVEGPLYVDDPPLREGIAGEDLRGVRGDGRRRRADRRRPRDLGAAAASRCRRRSSTSGRPARTAATTSGTSASRRSTSAARSAPTPTGATRSRRCSRSRTRCRRTGPTGRYLEAVGQHPWRPAHIHFKVTAPGHRTLVTQVFFPDDPYLENDTIGAVKPALVRPVERRGEHLGCDFDIALAPAA